MTNTSCGFLPGILNSDVSSNENGQNSDISSFVSSSGVSLTALPSITRGAECQKYVKWKLEPTQLLSRAPFKRSKEGS